MRMRKCYVVLVMLLISISGYSKNFTVSGIVEDNASGEKLLAANVFNATTMKGVTTNYYGFYSLSIPQGKVKIVCSYIGYSADTIEFDLMKDTLVNIKLRSTTVLQEVNIKGSYAARVKSTQMSMMSIPVEQTKKLPVLMGETDILKTIQMLPGIKGGTEGTSGIYVRGGGPDQNLILIDGVPVYNINHLFGLFSVFNSDAIQSFTILKGGFPARYGGRMSSVIDIKVKEGNNKEFKGEGSIGLISSKLTLQGPIIKNRTSFIVSGRRTYFDALTYPLIMGQTEGKGVGGYYFYDFNAKVNHRFSDKSHLYYSMYTGKDRFYMRQKSNWGMTSNSTAQNYDETDSGIEWGNWIHAVRYNHILSDILFVNIGATYSSYNFVTNFDNKSTNTQNKTDKVKYAYGSGITDLAGKIDFDIVPSTSHSIKVGGSFINHTFNPGVSVFHVDTSNVALIDTTFGNKNIQGEEFSFYMEDDIQITEKLKANIGIHTSSFSVQKKKYYSIQPRLALRQLFNDNLSVKFSYVEMTQYINLLTNSGLGLPTDLWVPATKIVRPQTSRQYAIGTDYVINEMFDISVEAYYKTMTNLVEYKEGASFFSVRDDWQQKLEQGKGTSQGIEILLQKKTGKLTGWIGYTLSKTDREFINIGFGKPFPFKYDRRHDLSIVSTYTFNEKTDVGAAFVFGTGNPITLPYEKYAIKNENKVMEYNPKSMKQFENIFGSVDYFENRNNYRMGNYYRLDLSLNRHKQRKYFKQTWGFGAYNVTNHQNPFYLDFDQKSDGTMGLFQYSILTIIPYVKYSITF